MYPVQILGIPDRLGTIEQGRTAKLINTDGTPLEIRTTYHHIIINGLDVGLQNKQLELYDKYRARPKN